MTRTAAEKTVRVVPGLVGQAWWLLCTAAAWYWALVYGGQAAWFVAATTGALMVYAGFAHIGMWQKPYVSRDVSQHEVHAGEPIRVALSISTPGRWFPLFWVIARDELRGADGKLVFAAQKLLFLGFRQRTEYVYEIPRLQRGIYTFATATIEAAEPLGIVGRRWRLDGAGWRRLTVYPQPLAEAAAEMPRRSGDSRAAAVAALAMVEASPLVSTVREYAHGDPLQRIHWKSTARTGELKTKELDALQQRRVAVVLDDAARGYGRGRMARARFETAASAACAVWYDAKRRCGLAVELCCGTQVAAAEAEAPALAERRALELLARAEPRGAAPLADVLQQRAASLKPEVPLIVITPQLDAQLTDAIAMLRRRRIAVTLIYITDPAEDLEDRNGDSARGSAYSRKDGSPNDAQLQTEQLLRHLEILGCRTQVIETQTAQTARLFAPAAESGDRAGGAVRYG
jgi:uncharacterized protein (DUF58 family)